MGFTPALHAEWIKIRPLRSLVGALCAMLSATVVFSALSAFSAGTETATDGDDLDPLFSALFGVNFGQIAAMAFATTAVSSEFRGGALRLSLAAVPHRGIWFAAKLTAIDPDPIGAWRRDDRMAIRGLALLELHAAGIRLKS